jgi:membrane-associated PAP2 superfamily phosphatase
MNQSADSHSPAALAAALPATRPFLHDRTAFWIWHAWVPLIFFTVMIGVVELLSLDRPFAEAWYFDLHARHWLGTGPGDWWAHRLLHTGGGWLVRGIGALALGTWLLSFASARVRPWRRMAGFITLSMLLSTGVVGGLKEITNVDCPWDLVGYGGIQPYITLFGDRPDALARGQCFPGAHASSGFALMCFYFALRDRSRRLARFALAGAIAVGIAFSIGQEARGAHFLSHDLTSAAIVWFVLLGVYALLPPLGRHSRNPAPLRADSPPVPASGAPEA